MISVSIIIPNYNGKQYLDRCFISIMKQTVFDKCEVIMIDNFSTDGSVEYVNERFPWVKIIQNKHNLGYAEGNNKAAKIAKGIYILFLNNDTWVESNIVEKILKVIEQDRETAVYALKIMNYEDKIEISSGMVCDIFGYPLSRNAGKFFYADGAAFFIRRNVFRQIGGFDKRYFMFYEDVDLSWRLRLYGYKISVVPEAVIHHVGGGTLTGGVLRKKKYVTTILRRYLGERNCLCTLLKNYGFLTLCFILPLYILINLGEISIFLIKGNRQVAGIYIKAWIWNIKNLRNTLERRRLIQCGRKISDIELMKNMYIGCIKWKLFREIGIPEFRKD